MNRTCKKCHIEKPIDMFYRHACGYQHTCKSCTAARTRKWALENKEKRWEIVKKSRSKSDVWKNYRNSWKSKTGATAKRKASVANRTPPWLNEPHLKEIRCIYELRKRLTDCLGIAFHVDHVVPLNGKDVSGLHVPWNLQVIPERLNLLKSNKLHFQLAELS